MHAQLLFFSYKHKFPSSIFHTDLDIALPERYKSVEDSPDDSTKRHQLLRCPGVPVEQYVEVGFNYVKTEGNEYSACCLFGG